MTHMILQLALLPGCERVPVPSVAQRAADRERVLLDLAAALSLIAGDEGQPTCRARYCEHPGCRIARRYRTEARAALVAAGLGGAL